VKPSSIGVSAGMGSTTAQMTPRLAGDRDQKATRFAQDIIELAAFRFCSLGASERCQFV
jgi:hypothetical protein